MTARWCKCTLLFTTRVNLPLLSIAGLIFYLNLKKLLFLYDYSVFRKYSEEKIMSVTCNLFYISTTEIN
jgi:hypothetical protein